MGSPDFLQFRSGKSSVTTVTIRANEDCTYLLWPIENLTHYFETSEDGPRLSQMLDILLGADVASKLFDVDAAFGSPNGLLNRKQTLMISPPFSSKNDSQNHSQSSLDHSIETGAIQMVDLGTVQLYH